MKGTRPFIGRGAGFNPPNRFESLKMESPPAELADYFELPDPGQKIPTRFYIDHSHSILSKNDSPDLGFTYSINPYRGCEHGCVYCYARPSHEYLGFSSGLDFESKIMVKLKAPELLASEFSKSSWHPQTVVFSGNTDCYQPAERKLQITRRCLEVFLRFRNPVSLITKNALIQRDMDILKDLASANLVFVIITLTTLRQELAGKLEPRAATPRKRLATIEALSSHGISVGVNVAPVIPGLTETEIPEILREASESGARHAGQTTLRLSYALKDIFLEWLKREYPEKLNKVVSHIRSIRGGRLSESEFGKRMTGEGPLAHAIENLFQTSCRKYHFNETLVRLSTEQFFRPQETQLSLSWG